MSLLMMMGDSGFNPRTLFANGEQGAWYDPTLTDAARTWRLNLLLRSEEISHSSWSKQNSLTVTADTDIGLDGLMSADTLTNTGVANAAAYQSVALPEGVNTFRVWVKAGTATQVTLSAWRSGVSLFATTTVSGLSSSYQAVDLTLPNNAGTGDTLVYIYPNTSSATTGSIVVSRTMLVSGGTVGNYQKITDFSTEFKAAFPTHELYQDSNGVAPVTAVGDLVGLVIDKSKGGLGSLGAELVTNGGLSDATGWTISGASPPSITGGQAVWTASTGEIAWSSLLVAGKWYKLEVDLTSYTSGTLAFRDGTTNTSIATTGATVGRKTFLINATSNQIRFISFSSATLAIDNISVREVPGNHAFQATSGNRPSLARVPFGGRRNLLSRTEEFDQSPWTGGGNRTVTANASAAPNDTQTADRVVISASGSVYVSFFSTVAVTASTQYTFSFYLNTTTSLAGNTIRIYNVSGGSDIVASQNCVYGGGWVRQTVTFTTPVGCTSIYVYPISISVINQLNSFFDIWGAQLETGSSATNYQKVTTAGTVADVTESGQRDCYYLDFASNKSLATSAIDFAGWTGTETRRNLLTNSSNFGAWSLQSATVTENSDVGPSGIQNADTLTNGGVGSSGIYQDVTSFSFSTQYTFSCWLKAGTSTSCVIGILMNGGWLSCTASVIGGAAIGSVSGNPTNITGLTSSWTRVQIVFTTAAAGNPRVHIYPETSGVGTGKTVVIADAQFELGNTASSYQATGTDEMTVIAGVRKVSDAFRGMICELSSDWQSNNGAFAIEGPEGTPGTGFRFVSKGTASNSQTPTPYVAPLTGVVTMQSKIATPSLVGRLSGVQITSSSASQGTGNFGNYALNIGWRASGTTLYFNSHIYQLIIRGKTTADSVLRQAERHVATRTGVTL